MGFNHEGHERHEAGVKGRGFLRQNNLGQNNSVRTGWMSGWFVGREFVDGDFDRIIFCFGSDVEWEGFLGVALRRFVFLMILSCS